VKPRDFFVRSDGGVRAPWRIAFFLGATVAAGSLVTGIVYPVVALTPFIAFARHWRIPLDQLATVLALLIGTYATLRLVDGVRGGGWGRVGLGRAGLRPGRLAAGLAAGTLAILVPSGILLATGNFHIERQPELQSWNAAARDALILLTPAALAEELLMRGYLLSALRDAIRAPGAIAVTSVVFGMLHLLNPGPTILSTAMVALAGVFLATVRLTTDSLYAAWVAHLAWNFVQASLLHAPVSGLAVATPGYRLQDAGPTWLTGGAWGPEGGLAAAAGMLLASFLLVWLGARFTTAGSDRPGDLANTVRSGRRRDT